LIEREVITRENGYLVRKKIMVKKYQSYKDRIGEYQKHQAAISIQSVWRGHMTRKWLQEIVKDADKMAAENKEQKKEGEEGVFQSRPIVDFWEQVIEPEETKSADPNAASSDEKEDDGATKPPPTEFSQRIGELEKLAAKQSKKIVSLESTIHVIYFFPVETSAEVEEEPTETECVSSSYQ